LVIVFSAFWALYSHDQKNKDREYNGQKTKDRIQ
jgi:hypothetical protein